MQKISYIQVGDYQIPNIVVSEQPEEELTKYGRMRLEYLKTSDKKKLLELTADFTLFKYLLLVQHSADEMYDTLMTKERAKYKSLKSDNLIEWVVKMDECQRAIEQYILDTYIYV